MQATQATHLSHKFTQTLGQIYQHPASHNLEWHAVVALIEHLGTVEEKGNGHLTFTINGVSAGFHRSPDKDVSEVQQVLDLRHFLENSGYGKNGASDAAADAAADTGADTTAPARLLVVINQKETLIFRSEDKDSVPQRLRPDDPYETLRLLKHTEGVDRDAQAPENLTYYESVAGSLVEAEEVLLMGNGTAASSAMNHLKDFLAVRHPQIAGKVVGALTVDVEALTEGQMLQEARAFFALRDGVAA